MALFDNITKKATEASAKAIQKGKELSDTARLNSLISDEEKKITNTYYQIGKLYVSIHRDSYESDFEGMIAALFDSENKISDYRKQIQDIKGVQHCEKCGAEVPKGSAFCSSCGATMPKVQAPLDVNSIKCENCGVQVKKGMRFCTNCGNPMPTVTAASSVVLSEDQAVIETEQSGKVCPNCGAKLDADTAFCTECGTKL